MFYIYMLKSLVNSKMYIGITKHFKKRKVEHKSALKNQKHLNFLLQNHYNKYCINKTFEQIYSMDIIETCLTREEGCQREIYWIDFFKNKGCYLFNLTKGGDGVILQQDIESKRIDKIRNKQKKVYAYTLSGNFIKEFRCIVEASEYFNINQNRISNSIRNNYRCGNYVFSRNKLIFDEYKSPTEVPVYVYLTDGTFIKKYSSITKTSVQMKLNKNAVFNAFNRGIRYKNYLFFRSPKTFTKYIPAKSHKIVYIDVFTSFGDLIDTVEGLTECSKKYNININSLNSRCRRGNIVNGIFFKKTYKQISSVPKYF